MNGRRIQEDILGNAEIERSVEDYMMKIENNLIKVSKNNDEYYRRIDLIPKIERKYHSLKL